MGQMFLRCVPQKMLSIKGKKYAWDTGTLILQTLYYVMYIAGYVAVKCVYI